MKRHHKHRHHRDRIVSCYSNDSSSHKSSATLVKAWLLTTCPLVIAASSNNNLQRHYLNNNYCIFNDRKRVRIKQRQERRRLGMTEFILQLRGGDDNNIMNNSHLTHHQHTVSQQTIIHPITTSRVDSNHCNDISESMNHRFNSVHNSYSAENEISSNMNYNVNNVVNTSSSSGKITNRLKDLQRGSLSSPPPQQQQQQDNTIESNQSTLPFKQQHQQNHQQQKQQMKGPRLVIEFDTQAINNSNKSLRSRIRSRIGNNENDWDRLSRHRQHGAGLSISVDLSPSGSQSSSGSSFDYGGDRSLILGSPTPSVYNIDTTKDHDNNNNATDLTKATIATILTTYTILKQSALLLPPLLLTRRALNSTRDAVVDYFRGRIFRTTFTRMERAYLRYYEFPAVIRAASRLASQIGILLVLSVTVRYWMFIILAGDVVGPLVLGMSGMDIRHDIGMVGTSSGGSIGGGGESLSRGGGVGGSILGLRNVGLPCYQRGRGMAWLCSLIWIGAVVGTGHACTVALSVWGGPLRLQAAADQAEKPKQLIWRAIHHPIKWIRELDEWKHLPELQQPKVGRNRVGARRRRRGGSRVFDPDPLLFPATWLPLRWIQIFAVAKAFSTDPQNYRWCSPDNDTVVIPKLMKQYLIQLALGDEWQRVFLGEKRVGLGILVVLSYFIALVWMVFTAFTLDGGSAAMLIPSVLAAIISGGINFMVFWNRLGTRSQKKALAAIGWA